MKQLTHWLIYAVLFFLPWQTHLILKSTSLNGQAWEYGTISLFAVDILIILALICHIWARDSVDLAFRRIPYRYFVVALLLFLVLAIPFSLSPIISSAKTAYLIAAILLVYILAREPIPFRSTSIAFVLGAATSGLLGIWQFISQSSFASSWLGVAVHDPSVLGVSVIEAIAPDGMLERWLRAYGSLDHPNMFGGFMAAALIFSSWLWLNRGDGQTRFASVATILSTIVIAGGLVVSFSRSAWIAAALGLLIIVIAYLRNNNRNYIELAAWIGSLVFVIIIAASQYGYLFAPRLQADSRLENTSIIERTSGLRDSLPLVAKDPAIGSGAGTYSLALNENIPGKPAWFYQPVHNVFLLITVELGLIGAIIFLAALVALLAYIYRKRKQPVGPLMFAVVGAVFIISLLDHWPYSLHFGIICSGAVIGLLANAAQAETLTE